MEYQRSSPAWWALAMSEDVTREKPVAARCGPDEVVLFRDKAGTIRAFEDRCPHRRVPLSLGRMKDGALQCGYHGWTFEGGTGKCIAIPNLDDNEKVPDRYAVGTYAAEERDGFVYIWTGAAATAPQDALPKLKPIGAGREFTGSVTLALPHDEFVAAMFDGPYLLVDLPTVRLTDFLLGDPLMVDGYWVLDRGAGWRTPHLPDRYVPDWPLVFRISVDPVTGQTLAEIRNNEEALLLSAVIASAPAARGATSVRWRCKLAPDMKGALPALTRMLAGLGQPPLAVKRSIDGDALAKLRVGPSHVLHASLRTTDKQISAAA